MTQDDIVEQAKVTARAHYPDEQNTIFQAMKRIKELEQKNRTCTIGTECTCRGNVLNSDGNFNTTEQEPFDVLLSPQHRAALGMMISKDEL